MALTYVFDGLSNVSLTPSKEKKVLRFRLVFGSSRYHQDTVQFEISAGSAVKLSASLHKVLADEGWINPTPGKPNLTIVSSPDEP
jgi:hypothetical protein